MPSRKETPSEAAALAMPLEALSAKALLRRHWEGKIRKSIVLHKGEKFCHAYRVELPVGERREWLPVILAITSSRLIVLQGGHFQIEADIGDVAHAYRQRELVSFTLKGVDKNLQITVRSTRASSLRGQLVKRAEQRLGHGSDNRVALFLADMVVAAADAQSTDEDGDD